jgi:hypothetical protein
MRNLLCKNDKRGHRFDFDILHIDNQPLTKHVSGFFVAGNTKVIPSCMFTCTSLNNIDC